MENTNGVTSEKVTDKKEETTSQEQNEEGGARKRNARVQLTSDNPEESDDETEQQQVESTAGWRKADAGTIANRRIVKVRRGNSTMKPENLDEKPSEVTPATTTPSSWPKFQFSSTETASSPFARLAALSSQSSSSTTSNSSETKEVPTDVGPFTLINKEGETTANNNGSATTSSASSSSSSSSSTTSSTNLFGGSNKFDFTFSTSSAPVFGFNIAPPKSGSTPSTFAGVAQESSAASPSALPQKTVVPLPAEPVQTGEEDEDHLFQNRAKLYVLDGATSTPAATTTTTSTATSSKAEGTPEESSAPTIPSGPKWRERGIGNFRVNVKRDKSQARMLMRVEGSLRLVLNALIWPTMKFEKVGDKQVRFTATSTEKEGELCSYLVRFGNSSQVEELIKVLENIQHASKEQATSTKENVTSV